MKSQMKSSNNIFCEPDIHKHQHMNLKLQETHHSQFNAVGYNRMYFPPLVRHCLPIN